MSYEKSISDQYMHGSLLKTIEAGLPKIGKTPETISIEDLSLIDEFHIGGRQATDNLIEQLNFSNQKHLLDIGCGLGGSARYLADKYDSCVTGIDLTSEYIEAGNILNKWVGLDNKITLRNCSAVSMPFPDDYFGGAYMLHVAMNISDKPLLFSQTHRVLKPGAFFGIYDVMRFENGELSYPVPWASDSSTCYLSSPAEYKKALKQAGFEVLDENNRREFALQFFKNVRKKVMANGGPPPIGLHTLMQESAAIKTKNMVYNISQGYFAPVEIIARKSI